MFASTGVVNILARLASFLICLPRLLGELDQLIQDLRAELDAGRSNPQQLSELRSVDSEAHDRYTRRIDAVALDRPLPGLEALSHT